MRYLAPIPSQFLDENGTPYYNGKVYVYIHGDSQLALADIYQNAETDELAENPATLDSHGMWQAFVDSDRSFDYIVKDSDGNVVAQFYDVTFPTGEGVPEIYVESRDGTINVEKSLSEGRQTFNIEVNKDTFKPAYARFTHSTVTGSGTDVELDSFEPDGDGNSDIYLTDGKLTLAKGLYHVSMNMCLGNDSLGNEYLEVIISFGGNELKKVWDGSFIHEESVELGMDISVEEDSSVVLPTINDFPEGMYCSITRLDVHSVGGAGAAGSHSVEHDGTLVGDGTHENPLGVKDYSEIRSDVDAVSESLTRHETANDAHQDIRDDIERKEDKDNKVTSWGSTPSNEKYPSEKLVKDTIDNLPPGTAVKGDAESEYRTGNVNLTPANIGAATASQGAKADTAVQGVKVNGTELSKDSNNKVDVPIPTASTATPLKDGTASAGSSSQWARGDHRHPTDDSREAVSNKKQSIDPTSTTEYGSSKAVADFVNSSVATNTANFLGSFSLADLSLTYPATDVQIAAALNSHTWPSGVTPTNNDYVYVEIQDPQTTGIDDKVERFKYSGLLESWGYEYTLNNSSFTAAEMATLESGVTASDKTAWNSHVSSTSNPHNVTAVQVGLGNVDNTSDANKPVSTAQQTALNAKLNIDGSNGTKEGVSALINKLDGGTATPQDGDFFVSQYAGGGSSNLSFYRRPMSSLWNYIRGKILGWYDWTRVDSGTGRYAKICSMADPASGTSYTVDVLVTHMTSYYAVTGLVRITVSHGSSSVQASILASDSLFYAVDSGNPPKVYTYVDGNGKRTFVFDTASAYQTAQGFVFRAVGGFSDKWSFFGDVGCSNDAAYLGSIGTKQDALDVTFVFASYAKTAGHAETATNYASSGGIADALAGKSSTNHAHDDRYVLFVTNSQGLTDTQKSNARTNIGAGTSSLTLGTSSNTAAHGNHAHGRLDREGYLGDEGWAVSNLDRIVIAKDNYNGKEGYLVPSALYFDSNESDRALTQSAEWKKFLPPTGDGSSVSVTPDGTSTGTDIGNSTTLKVWAQKYKNLESGLGRAAYKNTPMNGWNASSSEVVMGNDTRLTDARTPTAHNHDTLYLKSPSSQTLQWGGSVVIGTYNGNNITLTMPANPFNPNGDYSSNTLRANTAVSADSAQYAVGASNYTQTGTIATFFGNLTNRSSLGFTHWKLSSPVVSYTPTSSKKYIDGWDRGNDTNKRRSGVAFLYIQNNTNSTIYFDLKVTLTPASGTAITYTFTLGCLGSCGVPFTYYMDLNHYKYDFSIYKNPSLSTGSVTCYIGGLVYTGIFESTDT